MCLQTRLSHGLQAAASSHALTPSFSSSPQLHSAMTAAALGGGPAKHAAARSLQQASKVGGPGSVATWRKQSGSNTGSALGLCSSHSERSVRYFP